MSKTINLKSRFTEEIIPKLKEILGEKNSIAIPKVTKITINSGLGPHVQGGKGDFEFIVENIAKITGQKPVITKAKKAISNFKIREENPVGVAVTLRGKRMYDFLNKLINIVFPRVRDFRGLSPKSFDGHGNYCIGFTEHIVFPEISPDDVIHLHGLQVNISTSAETDELGFELLKSLGFPFKKPNT
ncbi:MAG: 50S ribosomal protein L5 [bacterium]|nr:50S ribosomal protein L5 [bacterium]